MHVNDVFRVDWRPEAARTLASSSWRGVLAAMACACLCSGCAVVAVAGAAVTVVSTTVSVGASVVGTGVEVAAAGVKAVVGSDDAEE
jgi:hypothetical protein